MKIQMGFKIIDMEIIFQINQNSERISNNLRGKSIQTRTAYCNVRPLKFSSLQKLDP